MRRTILLIEPDAATVEIVVPLLADAGYEVVALAEPARAGSAIAEVEPDAVVMAADFELARALRHDARWHELPLLVLLDDRSPETVASVYEAGADDFVMKPVFGPELVTRLTHRFERRSLIRQLAEDDPVTGAANRQRGLRVLDHYLKLAKRQTQPVSVAVVNLDRFKAFNDAHGHAAGDRILRRVAELLYRFFRAEDVVARWGGEEFLVGMYGCNREDGIKRLEAFLSALDRERFTAGEGSFALAASAGLAEFPGDGELLQPLYRAADAALRAAKAAGGARVMVAGAAPPVAAEGAISDW